MPADRSFDELAEELRIWVDALASKVESLVPQARAVLEGNDPHPMGAPSKESAAELILRGIGKRIEDVMAVHDALLETIEMSPRYKVYFDALELTDEGWDELLRVLKQYRKLEDG